MPHRADAIGRGRRVIARLTVALVVVGSVVAGPMTTAGAGAAGAAASGPPAAGTTTTPVYYLALGDSLAAGTGASSTTTRYANVLAQHEAARFAGLQLVDLACGGATTASMLNGPGCSYTTGTQVGDAVAFLEAHAGQVAFATIDIGANDVDGCLSGLTVNLTCVTNGVTHIESELPQILGDLRAADPGLAVYGMDYYDPFLGVWLDGAAGQAAAQQSESLAVALNTVLTGIYATAGAATADVATPFQTTDFDLTGSYLGTTVPQNVADVCNWTLFCSGGGNIHANDTGHGLVATAFAQVVDTFAVVTPTLPAATRGSAFGPVTLVTSGPGVSDSPYTTTVVWRKVALPAGLHLSRAGVLSGTPSRRLTAGTSSITVQATETVTTVRGRSKVHQTTSVQATLPLTLS